jgi:hypothetical protein
MKRTNQSTAMDGDAMINTTRKQREALARITCRSFPLPDRKENMRQWLKNYRELRKSVSSIFDAGCIMVPWRGMWLGIETDGYTHS